MEMSAKCRYVYLPLVSGLDKEGARDNIDWFKYTNALKI